MTTSTCTVNQNQLTKHESYQGYSNYPTWAANLWISNDPYWNDRVLEIVKEHRLNAAQDAYPNQSFGRAADDIKDMVWYDIYDVDAGIASAPTAGLAADLFNFSFGEIDWREVAEHYWDEE